MPMSKLEDISVTFIQHDGTKVEGKGKEGDNLLDIIVNNDIDVDGNGYGYCDDKGDGDQGSLVRGAIAIETDSPIVMVLVVMVMMIKKSDNDVM